MNTQSSSIEESFLSLLANQHHHEFQEATLRMAVVPRMVSIVLDYVATAEPSLFADCDVRRMPRNELASIVLFRACIDLFEQVLEEETSDLVVRFGERLLQIMRLSYSNTLEA